MNPTQQPSFLQTFRDRRLWLLGVFFLALSATSLNDVMVYSPDSARYLVWAESLSRFEGFVDRTVVEPVRYVVHAPLYSVLLAPVSFVAQGSVIAAKFFTALCGVALLALFYVWLSKSVSPGTAVFGCLVLALNPLVVLFSTQILSEIPFGVVVVALALLLPKLDKHVGSTRAPMVTLLGVLVAAVFVREIGLTVLIATFLFFLVRRSPKRAFWAAVVPLLFYLAWFVRNEVLVAGAELPPMRNADLLMARYFTPPDASLASEFLARIQVSLPIYLKSIGSLLLFPQYGTVPYGVVITTEPPYSLVESLVSLLFVVLTPLSIGLFIYGIVTSFRKDLVGVWVLLFLPLYLLMILIYPFYDIRFLFPFLLLLAYFAIVGGESLIARFADARQKQVRSVALIASAIILIPNAVWCYAFVRENLSYRTSPEDFYASIAGRDPFPNSFTKAISQVGTWIADHTDTASVIVTRWKEVTFWLPGSRLVELNALVPLDEFESHLRDYGANYLLSSVSARGIRDYEEQMALSTKFRFQPLYRVANMEVIKVVPIAWGQAEGAIVKEEGVVAPEVGTFWAEQMKQRSEYLDGLRALEEDSLEKAKRIFERQSDETNRLSKALFYLAIAHEFEGDFPRARQKLWEVPMVSQSGPFLGHAVYHRQIIDLLERATWEVKKERQAELYYTVSIRYWLLGFRTQSLKVLGKSLDADPRFLPALAFGVFFNLQLEREKEARGLLEKLRSIDPQHVLAQSFGAVFAYQDSLKRRGGMREKASYRLEVAKAYLQAGLGESAIDELLRLLREQPDDLPALRMLANLYETRRRYSPEVRILERITALDPGDSGVRERLRALHDR